MNSGGGLKKKTLGPLCLFSLLFFSRFFLSFFLAYDFFIFSAEKVSSFLFFLYFLQIFLLLALVSEFINCFLRSRCSMEIPDDIGRDSWDWVGRTLAGVPEEASHWTRFHWALLVSGSRGLGHVALSPGSWFFLSLFLVFFLSLDPTSSAH